MIDLILFCLLGIATIAIAVLGGHMSSANLKHRISFYVLGGISVLLIFITGYRTYLAQMDAKEASGRLDKTITSLRDTSQAISNMSEETVRIGRLNTQLQERLLGQNKVIADLSKQSINITTGGDSFGYIAIMTPCNLNSCMAQFISKGKYPLYGVKARISIIDRDNQNLQNLRSCKTLEEALEIISKNDFDVYIGDAYGDVGQIIGTRIPLNATSEHTFLISFMARNGTWYEHLKIVNMNGKHLTAIKVHRGGSPLFEQIDDNFPRNKKGEIEWFK